MGYMEFRSDCYNIEWSSYLQWDRIKWNYHNFERSKYFQCDRVKRNKYTTSSGKWHSFGEASTVSNSILHADLLDGRFMISTCASNSMHEDSVFMRGCYTSGYNILITVAWRQ